MPDKQKTRMDESKPYKYIIENIKDVVWEMDENMVFTFVSPTVLQLSGYEVCEVLGKSLFEFLTEDSKVHTQKAKKKFTEELAKGKTKKSFLHDVLYKRKAMDIKVYKNTRVQPQKVARVSSTFLQTPRIQPDYIGINQ